MKRVWNATDGALKVAPDPGEIDDAEGHARFFEHVDKARGDGW